MFGKLKDALTKFARIGVADKGAVEELVKDLQRTLIAADVDVGLVFELSKRIKEEALSEKIPAGLTRKEHVVKIVYSEVVKFLGENAPEIALKPKKILLVGLFGSGKTTTASKLAKFYMKKGMSVGLIAADTYRPAAVEQLKQLGKALGVEVYGTDEKDASKVAKDGLKHFSGKQVVIVDSAGRSALDEDLRKELKDISKAVKADERLLVLSGDIGQAAKKQAVEFNEIARLTGVILTKMDSSAKGGGALSACHAANTNVQFIGTGEKAGDFEVYDPTRFVSRMLGMGDLEGLLEKAKDAMDPEKAQELMEGEFTLESFYAQMEGMKKMGSFGKIMEMIPGMGAMKLPKHMMDEQEGKMQLWKYIIDSMTPEEKRDPDDIDSSRMQRIAKGAGTETSEVKNLIKNFRQIRKMLKKFQSGGMKGGAMKNIMKAMGGA